MNRRTFLSTAAQAGGAGLCLGLPVATSAATLPVPELARWKNQMSAFGAKHGQSLADPAQKASALLGATYYDAIRVYYQIADYSGDRSWLEFARHAVAVYRDGYVLPNKGAVPGYWVFPHGLALDWQRRKERRSREAVVLLSKHAAYATDATPVGSTRSPEQSREVAYCISALLKGEEVGERPRARLELLVEHALGHCDQWFVSRTAPYVRPFMAGITAEGLIGYFEGKKKSQEILKAIKTGLDWLWDNTWVPAAAAFKYTDRRTESGGTNPAPDLNLLLAPAYAWLYHRTGDVKYRARADRIFAGGVRGAFLNNPKQFNQSYRWSFDYLKWRQARPATTF